MYPIQIKNKNKKLYIERTFTKKVHNLAKPFFFFNYIRSVHGSSLCPTRNRHAGVGWEKRHPPSTRRSNRVGQFRTSTSGGRVGRIQDGEKTMKKT